MSYCLSLMNQKLHISFILFCMLFSSEHFKREATWIDTGYRGEDLKGGALLLSERFLLKRACMIFYMISCTQGELISFPWVESPSEHCFGRNFDVTDTNHNQNRFMPFIFMNHLKCNSREYQIKCPQVWFSNNCSLTTYSADTRIRSQTILMTVFSLF